MVEMRPQQILDNPKGHGKTSLYRYDILPWEIVGRSQANGPYSLVEVRACGSNSGGLLDPENPGSALGSVGSEGSAVVAQLPWNTSVLGKKDASRLF
jgi:hypothetical protein